MEESILNYQEAIAKIYIAALNTLKRPIGRETFISILKGKKNSKIVTGKYYENSYYGIFSSFKGNEVSNILDYLIEDRIIEKNVRGNNTFIYTNKTENDLYKYYFNFIRYISDNTISLIRKEDQELYDNLKNLRYKLSLEENVKPHNICGDNILREMCNLKPKTKERGYGKIV